MTTEGLNAVQMIDELPHSHNTAYKHGVLWCLLQMIEKTDSGEVWLATYYPCVLPCDPKVIFLEN